MATRTKRGIGEAGWGWTAFAGVISFIYFFPVLWIIMTAFKSHNDALAIPPKWLFTPTLEHYPKVFIDKGYRRFPVTDDNRLVGQISRRDVLRALEVIAAG